MGKTINEKIAEVREFVEVIQRSKAGYGYKYVPEEEILMRLSTELKKQKLDVYPSIVPSTTKISEINYLKVKTTNKETRIETPVHEMLVQCDMMFKWVNLEEPFDTLEIPWAMTGQQADPSQAFGSGLSYCTRYFYLKFFKVATPEDCIEEYRSKQKEAEVEKETSELASIIDSITDIMKKYVGEDKDRAKAVKDLVVLHNNKDANYMKIKDVEVASLLREELKKLIKGKKEE